MLDFVVFKVNFEMLGIVVCVVLLYGVPFVKILNLTDLAQKLLSLRIFSYLCAEIEIPSLRAFSYLCAEIATSAQR